MEYNFSKQFDYYASLVNEVVFEKALLNGTNELEEFFKKDLSTKMGYVYEKGKWTIFELIQHLIDTERIFQYRALAIARGDCNELPGYDHELYAKNSSNKARSFTILKEEFLLLRKSSILLFSSLSDKDLERIGTANKLQIKAKDIAFLLVGHQRHHLTVLKERYLV